MWLTHPPVEFRDPRTGTTPDPPYPEADPARMRRYNELVRALPALRPERVRVVDVAARLAAQSADGMGPAYRSDGVHWDTLGALRFSREWFADRLLAVYREAGDGPVARVARPSD